MNYIKELIKQFNNFEIKEKIVKSSWCNNNYISYYYDLYTNGTKVYSLYFDEPQTKRQLKRAYIHSNMELPF